MAYQHTHLHTFGSCCRLGADCLLSLAWHASRALYGTFAWLTRITTHCDTYVQTGLLVRTLFSVQYNMGCCVKAQSTLCSVDSGCFSGSGIARRRGAKSEHKGTLPRRMPCPAATTIDLPIPPSILSRHNPSIPPLDKSHFPLPTNTTHGIVQHLLSVLYLL